LVDPQRIGRPGQPLTQRTMVAGGLTLIKSDANNDADNIAMITVSSILIDYSKSGLSNRDVGIINGTK